MTSTPDTKISPAFESFRTKGDADSRREALVVYRTEPQKDVRGRGRPRAMKVRLNHVQASVAAQQSVESKLIKDYNSVANKGRKADTDRLEAEPVRGPLPVVWAEVTPETLTRLAENDDVIAILPNEEIRLIKPKRIGFNALSRQERRDKLTWGLKALDIPKLWGVAKGKGVNVAVLDTGVHGDHPALAGRVKAFVIVDPLGRRILTKDDATFDSGLHGTHVCGTVAGGKTSDGVSIGVAPEATLFVGGVLVGNATLRTLIEGISWAVEKGADIISMSLGMSYYEPLFNEVFDVVLNTYHVLPVVAIGNENYGNSSSPGNVPNAFGVGAVEKMPRGKTSVTFFSSGASLVFPGAELAQVNKPDVVAPGAEVFSCIPPEKTHDGTSEYAYLDGTSMATPHVSGVAALLMAAQPEAPVGDIIYALKETAKHPQGTKNRPDNRWGYGLIQPVEALKALRS